MFGPGLIVPVPDIDRTDHLLVLGANPYASNGSLATAPDWPGRIEALRRRGGRLVVVDPRRSRTAEEADEHVSDPAGHRRACSSRPWSHVLFAEGLVDLGDVGAVRRRARRGRRGGARRSRPRPSRRSTGIDAATIRRLARELAAAPTAASTAASARRTARVRHARQLARRRAQRAHRQPRPARRRDVRQCRRRARRTRRGAPRDGPGRPLGRRTQPRARAARDDRRAARRSCLAEEIDTPGDGQVRALVTVAGNPVLSTPNGGRLDAALDDARAHGGGRHLRNETTRHADVILPAPAAAPEARTTTSRCCSSRSRNVANYSPPVLPLDRRPARRSGRSCAKLALIAQGDGRRRRPRRRRRHGHPRRWPRRRWPTSTAPSTAATPTSSSPRSAPRRGPERLLDLMLRTGPYGDGFGAGPTG